MLCLFAAPKSQIDQLLEQLQDLVDTYLPIIAPFIGLTEKQAFQFRKQFDQFVADVEALEHGQVPVTEGLQAIVTDILEMLKILGIDWTAPSKCRTRCTYRCETRVSDCASCVQ